MLDGLALARWGALRDCAGDEDDELACGVALEVAEVANVRGVGQNHRLRARTAAGGRRRRAPRAGGRLQHQERRNLHRTTARSVPLTIRRSCRDSWMDGDRTQPRRNKKQAPSVPLQQLGFGRTALTCTRRMRFPKKRNWVGHGGPKLSAKRQQLYRFDQG